LAGEERVKIRFEKMHGCGNDFVVVDGRKMPALPWSNVAARLLDRRFGVGGDQFLVILPSSSSDARMAIFERDGRESEMCGNGVRCVARFLSESGDSGRRVTLETLGGIKTVEIESPERFRADMGVPIPDPQIWGKELNVAGRSVLVHSLSMGNPHAVIFVKTIDELDSIGEVGPAIEVHPWFPKRTNVELVFVRDESNVVARIWERGAGETLACGTGASALAVASIREGRTKSPVQVHFKGGTLEIAWRPGESVRMTGPATHVFSGEVEI
jgi:diaminopimelate epimerase